MPDILVAYTIKGREYQVCRAIVEELKRRGYSVALTHRTYRSRWIYQFFSKPKVIVGTVAMLAEILPGINSCDWYTDSLRGRAPFLLNLQTEQVFRDGLDSYNIVTDPKYIDRIYYVCWGIKRKEQLLRHGIPETNIILSNAPHLDFLLPCFRGFYKSKKQLSMEYCINSDKQWILLISGFLWASWSRSSFLQSAEQIRIANGKNGDPMYCKRHDAKMLALRRDVANAQKITLDWVGKYLEGSDKIVIYRPHPGEIPTEYVKKMIDRFPNQFFYIGEESVQQWIQVSEVINIWNSTAAVEVYAAKKHCNLIQPFPLDAQLCPIIFDKCKPIDNYDDFALSQDIQDEFAPDSFPINVDILKSYYCMDETPSYMRICDFIEKIYIKNPPDSMKNNKESNFTLNTVLNKEYMKWLYMNFFALTKIKLSWLFPWRRKGMKDVEKNIQKTQMYQEITFNRQEKKAFKRIKKFVHSISREYKGE